MDAVLTPACTYITYWLSARVKDSAFFPVDSHNASPLGHALRSQNYFPWGK